MSRRRGGQFGRSGNTMTALLLMGLRIWPVYVVQRLGTYGVEVWEWQVFDTMSRLSAP